mgnify:CR=1 FL=1
MVLGAMLVFVALLAVVGLYIGYRVHRSSQRIEGLAAATSLEARRVLSQHLP